MSDMLSYCLLISGKKAVFKTGAGLNKHIYSRDYQMAGMRNWPGLYHTEFRRMILSEGGTGYKSDSGTVRVRRLRNL